ncbi:hypothetical protein AXG93_464s1050 [Marchantia polymorpha subsp. ruderalis]|uniref:Uncharacterized protein n=1 Tax=Marchantia polymorpha subsp. ruderalis TaxID=1480154 RepID=A0A176WS51_MARPO|nr:hypothetical protein AXG93_464s1050 [Marchantia polymorpha subsp. ruderalis]
MRILDSVDKGSKESAAAAAAAEMLSSYRLSGLYRGEARDEAWRRAGPKLGRNGGRWLQQQLGRPPVQPEVPYAHSLQVVSPDKPFPVVGDGVSEKPMEVVSYTYYCSLMLISSRERHTPDVYGFMKTGIRPHETAGPPPLAPAAHGLECGGSCGGAGRSESHLEITWALLCPVLDARGGI